MNVSDSVRPYQDNMLPSNNKYEKRKRAILAQIDINDYIQQCMWRFTGQKQKRRPVIRTQSDAECFKRIFSDPINSPIRSMLGIPSGDLYKYCQDVDYVSSNVGRGFIFYFICVWCGRRVKYLFVDENLEALLCRRCIRLPYQQPSRAERKISRYIRRHPEVAAKNINTFIAPNPW